MKTMIIGDIHGCNAALTRLLDQLRPDPDADRLILLGDLFDRGPDSWEVLRTVQTLEAAFGERFTLLRGNHEDYLLQERLPLSQRLIWDRVGRQATVNSFRRHRERMEDSAPWLRAHCRLFCRGDGFQCVHAGILVDPLEANDTMTLLHDHQVALRNVYSGPLTITGHIALDDAAWFAGDGETVVRLKEGEIRPLPETGVICIDTGCGKGGRLTGMVVEAGTFTLRSAAER